MSDTNSSAALRLRVAGIVAPVHQRASRPKSTHLERDDGLIERDDGLMTFMGATPISETHSSLFAKTRNGCARWAQRLGTKPNASHLVLVIEFVRDSRTETRGSDHVNATAKSARGDCCDPHVWRRRHFTGEFCTRGELPFCTKFYCPAWQALVLQSGSRNSAKMLVYPRDRSGG